ncbi:MAG: accessory Sec system translocase SecA2 [Bacteroidota bacterium]
METEAGKENKWSQRWRRLRSDDPVDRDLSWYRVGTDQITEEGRRLAAFSDNALKLQAKSLRNRVLDGIGVDEILGEAFALAREVSARVLGMRHYDVQVMAGLGLHKGKIIEMQTGEGKTLAAVLPVFAHALSGKGVHVLTFNDYLARRDAAWMGPVYTFLGLSVGVVQAGMSTAERRAAYAADVTYATAKEAGFDFLRDNLARTRSALVQRPFHFAVIDEADSILIDEARVPLVIAGAREVSDADPYRIAAVVEKLQEGTDWETDENRRNVLLTGAGIDKVEAAFQCGDLHEDGNYLLLTEINQALHARVLLHRGVDYIIRDQKIVIVDEFTGRVVADRRWPDGLQEAIEAKEELPIEPGGRILGSIALQNFLRLYPQLAGMTATSIAAAHELENFYTLRVLPIPRNTASIREDLSTIIFTHQEAKVAAVIDEIKLQHRRGRPVLVGTTTVNESETLALQLRKAGIESSVLNARNDEAEAEIIANAGLPGRVTISTNMAGRGTDIKLGGADELYRDEVIAAGGLLVLGTNLHESRRIDDQLRGRAGRQGDPGSAQFFVSMEDHLMRTFGLNELIPDRFRPVRQARPIDHPVIIREVARLQRIVEGQNYEIRKTMWKYTQLIEKQRTRLMDWRNRVLLGEAELTVFETHVPDRFKAVCNDFGHNVAYEAEQVSTLHFIDQAWSDHLAYISHIRDGIHLLGIGGLNPLHEFHKQAGEAFVAVFDTIEQRTKTFLETMPIDKNGIDAAAAGLKGPSSTWTYLINDKALNDLQQMLFGHGSAAFVGLGGLVTWPLLLAWGIWERMRNRD